MDIRNDLIEKFKDWAEKGGWMIELSETKMELPLEVTDRYQNIPKQWLDFIINFDKLINSTEDMWFLTCENFLNDVWSYNDFENMSLEAADGDEEWSEEIKEFWNNTFPIIMGVGGEYQYYGISLESGNVVHGWDPEFESPYVVAESFVEFLGKLIVGEIEF